MLNIFSCARWPYFLWKNVYSNLLLSFNQIIFLLSGSRSGNPLQYSCLGSPRGRGAWQAIVHGDAKSRHS